MKENLFQSGLFLVGLALLTGPEDDNTLVAPLNWRDFLELELAVGIGKSCKSAFIHLAFADTDKFSLGFRVDQLCQSVFVLGDEGVDKSLDGGFGAVRVRVSAALSTTQHTPSTTATSWEANTSNASGRSSATCGTTDTSNAADASNASDISIAAETTKAAGRSCRSTRSTWPAHSRSTRHSAPRALWSTSRHHASCARHSIGSTSTRKTLSATASADRRTRTLNSRRGTRREAPAGIPVICISRSCATSRLTTESFAGS